MPLPIPNLDDRTFEQLVAEGRALIPRHSPSWTNHNQSDPGITLLELFAFLTEPAMFQVDQVPATTLEAFLRLIEDGTGAGSGNTRLGAADSLDQRIARQLQALGTSVRAVTAADFERLAREIGARQATPIARTAFRTYRDTACAQPQQPDQAENQQVAAVVIVVPDLPDDPVPTPEPTLIKAIFTELRQHRLLATSLHVVGPTYVTVGVQASVARRRGSGLSRPQLDAVIREFLHPIRGWFDGSGWPFGRDVYFSELFQLLEGLPGVDHVDDLVLTGAGGVVVSPGEGGRAVPANGLVRAGAIVTTVTDAEGG